MEELERILVGDDEVDFARETFPFIPNAEVEFVDNPQELIKRALSGKYSTIVTDLSYSIGRQNDEGFDVLNALKDVKARKILWTGYAQRPGVKERAKSLGAEVLDKNEIGTLVGQVVSNAPLKEKGKVLIYVHEGVLEKAMRQSVGLLSNEDQIVVSSDLKNQLATNQYGLVIDASTIGRDIPQGTVAHDMKYLKLKEVPRVVTISDLRLADILRIAGNYLKQVGTR
jgi:hypothetical protein